MSETTAADPAPPRVDQPLIPPFLPRMIHRLALPIVLVWLGIVVVTNTAAPQLEAVAKEHSVSQSPTDAASFQSMMRVGKTFKEFDSDSSAMIVSAMRLPISGSLVRALASRAAMARQIPAGSSTHARNALRLPIPFTVVNSSKNLRSCS